jgi:hypothetical protein
MVVNSFGQVCFHGQHGTVMLVRLLYCEDVNIRQLLLRIAGPLLYDPFLIDAFKETFTRVRPDINYHPRYGLAVCYMDMRHA